MPVWEDPGDAWHFAELEGLVEILRDAADQGLFMPDPNIPLSVKPSEEAFKRALANFGASKLISQLV